MNIEELINELIRILSTMIRNGKILEYDEEQDRVKVDAEGLPTPFRPYFTPSSGYRRSFKAPAVGERCLVFSPYGVLANCYILTGIDGKEFKKPDGANPKTELSDWPDGTRLSYNFETSTFELKGEKLKLAIEGIELDLKFSKIKIGNGTIDVLKIISDALEVITKSKTATMAGPRELVPSVTELPKLKTDLDSIMG